MWLSFFIYSVLTALLPGPNNILALSSVQNVGYKNTRFLLLGIYAGFTFVMIVAAYISNLAVKSFEPTLLWLKYVGVIYLLYLAWSVAFSKPVHVNTEVVSQTNQNKTIDFWKGFLLQLINIKIIIYGITAFSSFILPHFDGLAIIIAFALLLSFIGSVATWIWALTGEKFAIFLNQHAFIINKIMGILLAYCAISLLL